ncbi:hypothetical protein FALBO_1564 [Fusarium albosuccineum]|uniref:Calpain catalytic domain-containing protein n=1 Tax=Fusarium albosuccineum TaxID=1237068 RepID=A0A8H4LL11_9HYPO|nr:hypothetical protein FALBO_1564 [Fusarium albosuccineum]
MKFSDPAFDIETDFSVGINNCLFGLRRMVSGHDVDEDNTDDDRGAKLLAVRLDKRFLKIIRGFCPSRKPTSGPQKPSQPGSVHRIPWVFKRPRFTIDGFSNSGIKQGKGGNCWWLAALGTIAHRQDIMERICVARDEDAGVYGFVFYRDGGYVSTVVDDNVYLAEEDYSGSAYGSTRKRANRHRSHKQSGSNALFFARCGNPNETWLPLLEKAYAKIHGDYQALDGGWAGTAIEDLTGGITSTIACKAVLDKERLWREMLDLGAKDGDFVYSLSTGPGKGHHSGLTPSHAYSVLSAVEVESDQGGKVRLVQIRYFSTPQFASLDSSAQSRGGRAE